MFSEFVSSFKWNVMKIYSEALIILTSYGSTQESLKASNVGLVCSIN